MPTGFYPRQSAAERFAAKVSRQPDGGCWLWTGAIALNGYGVFRKDGKTGYAHRAAYELFVGSIPASHDLDHLCRNRCCVNPQHLEAVTRQVNLLRGETVTAANAAKTHCVNGHPLIGDNLYLDARGGRSCMICRRAAEARRKSRQK